MSARLIAVSGLGPKEPAAFVVEAEGRRLLLDCGEGPEPGRRPDFDAIGRVDAVVLSHSHPDHVGGLKYRDRIGNPPVYATEPVLERVKETVFKEGSARTEPIPMRGRCDVFGVSVETGANGHAPGGVWLRLAVGDGLIYMGDHSVESGLYRFDVPPPTPTMIIDGSYGDAEETIERQREALAQLATRGPMLLPSPADGRAPEMAMVLLERGFDVGIDDAVRSVATMVLGIARESLRENNAPRLQRLLKDARRLDAASEAKGVMVAHGGSGDTGVAGELIKRWREAAEPAIVFTGHVAAGTTGKTLLDSGRARFQRWNVHPRLSDNLRLLEAVAPRRVIPAFGEPRHLPVWRERAAPRDVVSATTVAL